MTLIARLLKHTTDVVRRVYEAAGMDMDAETLADLQKYIDDSRKVLKQKPHSYKISDFGISEEEVDELFHEYHEQYLAKK